MVKANTEKGANKSFVPDNAEVVITPEDVATLLREVASLTARLKAVEAEAPNVKALITGMQRGEQRTKTKQYAPNYLNQPKFGDKERVKLAPTSLEYKAYAAAHSRHSSTIHPDDMILTVIDVPMALEKTKEWKYRVKLPEGMGSNGVRECDLIAEFS